MKRAVSFAGIFTCYAGAERAAVLLPEYRLILTGVVTFYLTGLGVVNPALETGMPATANLSVERVSTGFAAIDAVIEYAGAVPGLVGLNQINARVPANAPLRIDVPVTITVAGQQSNTVTVPIGPIPPGG